MTITISIPNDYRHDRRTAEMIDVVYDGEIDECKADGGDRAAEVLADVARDAGLEFVAATDFGGTWAGMPEQVAAARAALPSWASSTVA